MLQNECGAEIAIDSGISGVLFPRATLGANGVQDHFLSDTQRRQVNCGKVGGHWSQILCGIRLSG